MTLSPWHSGVLFAGAVLSAPALWGAFVAGTLPLDQALTRFLVCVVLAWVALNVALPLLVPEEPVGPVPDSPDAVTAGGDAAGSTRAMDPVDGGPVPGTS